MSLSQEQAAFLLDACKLIQYATEQGFMVRLTDKMSRLSSFVHAGKMNVQDESFMDTCVDVINYMVLLAAYLKDKEAQKQAASTIKYTSPSIPVDSNIGGGKLGA